MHLIAHLGNDQWDHSDVKDNKLCVTSKTNISFALSFCLESFYANLLNFTNKGSACNN
jgi:hypothetical protein